MNMNRLMTSFLLVGVLKCRLFMCVDYILMTANDDNCPRVAKMSNLCKTKFLTSKGSEL